MDNNGWKIDNKEQEIEEDTSNLSLAEWETQGDESNLQTEEKEPDDGTKHVENAD